MERGGKRGQAEGAIYTTRGEDTSRRYEDLGMQFKGQRQVGKLKVGISTILHIKFRIFGLYFGHI
jgi:hypothetical protein